MVRNLFPSLVVTSQTDMTDYERVKERFEEGEKRRNETTRQEKILAQKIQAVKFPMQELAINYGSQKQKVYSEDEDRYLLCRLSHYGLNADDVYEKIKRDISEFPVFRFDWFFKSRTPLELQRRCQQLLMLISKEKGGVSYYDDDDFAEDGPSRTKSGTKVRIVVVLSLALAG